MCRTDPPSHVPAAPSLAPCSHQELLSQLSSSTAELQDACGRLRALEVQRQALQEQLRAQEESLQGAVTHNTTLSATLTAK